MRHQFYRQHSQKASDQQGLNLEAYIEIERERITRKRVVFHSIRFNLDKNTLRKIQQARKTGRGLDISRELLADLRDYALTDGENHLQSGLTFYTYYLGGGTAEALMRSVISPDGDIFHQIKRDCLERPNFCRQIAAAHYWLIEQLLGQLRLRAFLKLNRLAWGLALAIALVVIVVMSPFIPQLLRVSPWLLLVVLLLGGLLLVGLQCLLCLFLPTLARWAWRQLLSGLLSRKPLEKKIAKNILVRLIP